MNVKEAHHEKYQKFTEEEKNNFWISTIHIMMKMQSSVADPYGIFCREFLLNCSDLEPEFDSYLDQAIIKLNLDKDKVYELVDLSLSNPERNKLLLD